MNKKISLEEAVKFHGHLGPYLILGILSGSFALKKLRCKKYFGIQIRVYGVDKKPKSCLIDGLQISTGATYGKGNIIKLGGKAIRIECFNRSNNKKIILKPKKTLLQVLQLAKTHRDSVLLAQILYKTDALRLFDVLSKSNNKGD